MTESKRDPIESEELGDVTVVRINAPQLLDDATTEEIFQRLYTLIATPGRHKFVVDVGSIQYFASAGLGKMVMLNRKAREAQARLVMCNVTPTVDHILKLTRLDAVLIAYASEREARDSFR
jgi:anti-anti-sigma factor